MDDALGKAFDNRRFSSPGSRSNRIVISATAEYRTTRAIQFTAVNGSSCRSLVLGGSRETYQVRRSFFCEPRVSAPDASYNHALRLSETRS